MKSFKWPRNETTLSVQHDNISMTILCVLCNRSLYVMFRPFGGGGGGKGDLLIVHALWRHMNSLTMQSIVVVVYWTQK